MKTTLLLIVAATATLLTSCGYGVLSTDTKGNVIFVPNPIVVPAK